MCAARKNRQKMPLYAIATSSRILLLKIELFMLLWKCALGPRRFDFTLQENWQFGWCLWSRYENHFSWLSLCNSPLFAVKLTVVRREGRWWWDSPVANRPLDIRDKRYVGREGPGIWESHATWKCAKKAMKRHVDSIWHASMQDMIIECNVVL